MRLLPLLLLFVASCNPCCFGQISLSETKVQVVTGLVAPQVVGESIIIGADSKPQVTTASLIEVKGKEKFKTFDIEAENVSNYSLAALKVVDETHWLLQGQGKFRVSAIAFGPDLGKDRLIIEISNEPPKPPPGPGPPKPPEPSNDTDKLVDDAMLGLRRGYGKAFASAADAIQSGQITIDAQLQSFMEPITKKARMDALAGIDGHIEDLIPRDGTKLKPEAAGFIRALSVSFERGTK